MQRPRFHPHSLPGGQRASSLPTARRESGGVRSARGRALRASNYPLSGRAPGPAAGTLRAPGPCWGPTPPVPVHLSPAAPGSQPPPAASGCSSEPPSPFCTGGRSHGTNPHCPRARCRRRRTRATRCGPGRAGAQSLFGDHAGRKGEGAGELGTADTVTEPEEEQQPPPPRSVYPRLTIPPPPVPSLDRPASPASLIGHPKTAPPLALPDWGRALRPRPLESAPFADWSCLTRPRLHPLFPIGDRIRNSASCSFPAFIGSTPTTGPPAALLVLAKSYREPALRPPPIGGLPKPPSYHDVTLPQPGDP